MGILLSILFVYLAVGGCLYFFGVLGSRKEDEYADLNVEELVTYSFVGLPVLGIRVYKKAESIIKQEL